MKSASSAKHCTQGGRLFGHNVGMVVNRIAWSITTVLFVIVSITLFLSGYDGYGGVFLAVAAAAGVNLIPFGKEKV